jgi:hypothetical protein
MMHGREKSDSAIVAGKPTNKAGQLAAEPVEPRAEAKGNASQQRTRRTQSRVSVSHALERIRQTGTKNRRFAVTHPRWEKLWGGRRRLWHLHRPYEPMEVAPWSKSMISAEA